MAVIVPAPYTQYGGIWKLSAASASKGAGTWPTAPGAPTIGTAVGTGLTSANVAFTPPSNTGIPAGVVLYTATSNPGNITATGTTSPISVTGLALLTAYSFTVTATGTSGLVGPPSASSNTVLPPL